MTTLFYLLASSGNHYKPVEWFSGINPTQQGNSFGQAVEGQVFGLYRSKQQRHPIFGLYI
jgi:hypothetical protein